MVIYYTVCRVGFVSLVLVGDGDGVAQIWVRGGDSVSGVGSADSDDGVSGVSSCDRGDGVLGVSPTDSDDGVSGVGSCDIGDGRSGVGLFGWGGEVDGFVADGWEECDEVFADAVVELGEYFEGRRKEFGIKMNPVGTEFQLRVWDELRKIPYGQTRSYRDIAVAVGNPKGARAVGMANNRNPLPIVIPCHRVIGANGELGGYAGGTAIKKKLLMLESGNMW